MRKVFCLWISLALAQLAEAAVLDVMPVSSPSSSITKQFQTIQEAANAAVAGDVVVIHSGVYRETVVVQKSGTRENPIRFEVEPGGNVVVTGLDRITNWRRENGGDNVYSTAWPYRFLPRSKTDAHPDDEFHRLIGRVEQVVMNESLLRQTLQLDQLSRGAFYVDLTNKRLYVSPPAGENLNANEVQVEASTRSLIWDCKGDYVSLRGIHFRYAANPAQSGLVVFRGRGDLAEDCTFERANGAGAAFVGPEQVARRCTFQDNGQLGFAGNRAHNLLITECTIANNNTKGFNRQWEAGGDKIVLSRGVILEKSRFLRNRGNGIWFDIGDENSTVRNCLIADNEDAGIFYEISYGLEAHDNVIVGNGFTSTAHAWGAQAGIVLSSSPNCVIARNLLVGNREGFNFREQARITPRIDNRDPQQRQEVSNHDDQIRNNIIAYNRDAQTRGWFGVSDQRQWPRKLQEAKPKNAAPPIAGISLEGLHLDLSSNLYAREENQPLFVWGTNWLRHVDYTTIAAISADLQLEQNSRVVPLSFQNFTARDFRLPQDSAAFGMQCYPQGEVPDVVLGPAR